MKVPIYKLKLVRGGFVSYPPVSANQPQLAAFLFHRLIGQAACEHSAALFVDARGVPLGLSVVAIGSLSKVPMVGREMFKAAILANASSLVVSHNHPVGSSKPSLADVRVTELLVRAGRVLGIPLRDHIIVTPQHEFTSMREMGLVSEA